MKTLNLIVLPGSPLVGNLLKKLHDTSILEHRGQVDFSLGEETETETERRNREIRRKCACVCVLRV